MTVAAMRRALAAVLLVDVLDHFLAPLVLEVDVDVGGSLRSRLMKRSNSTVDRGRGRRR